MSLQETDLCAESLRSLGRRLPRTSFKELIPSDFGKGCKAPPQFNSPELATATTPIVKTQVVALVDPRAILSALPQTFGTANLRAAIWRWRAAVECAASSGLIYVVSYPATSVVMLRIFKCTRGSVLFSRASIVQICRHGADAGDAVANVLRGDTQCINATVSLPGQVHEY